ncbi:hypothetical protein ISS30_11315 [bacterium]|nr:hypothetical protein [bacterium]
MKDEKEKKTEFSEESEYIPPRIVEKRKLEVELFSDEPDPWGCGPW